MLQLTDVVKNLLILNVLFFVGTWIDASMGSPLRLEEILPLYYPGSDKFMPMQLVTHFFMHANFMHIAFNMFALVMFGPPLEMRWGAKKFLVFYLLCALGSAALHLGWTWYNFSGMEQAIDLFRSNPSAELFQDFFGGGADRIFNDAGQQMVTEITGQLAATGSVSGDLSTQAVNVMEKAREFSMDTPMVGASGAIYGLLLGFGMTFPNHKLMLIFLPVPIAAKYFIPALMLIELFLGFQRYSWDPIAHFAHLGGALVGLLIILYWRRQGPPGVDRWDS